MKTLFKTESDAISSLIEKGVLADHREHFPQIVEDLRLQKSLKVLREMEGFALILPLAMNRALNFYEAATATGLPLPDTRVGVISSILTAGTFYDSTAEWNTQETGIPSYLSRHITLEFLKEDFTEEEIAQIKMFTSKFTAVRPKQSDLKRLTVPMLMHDAFLCWPAAKDKDLIDFMTGRFHRGDYLPYWAKDSFVEREMRSYGVGQGFRMMKEPYNTTFFTTWGRVKNFELAIAAKLNKLSEDLAKEFSIPFHA